MFKKFVTGLCLAAVLVFGSTVVHAVPSLGVGTGTFDCTGATEYWECFSGNLGGHAFALPASGVEDGISPFTNITQYDIWLLAEPSIGTFSFAGLDSTAVSTTGAFASYDTPYQGVNLGQVDGDWTAINTLFNPGDFFMLPGTLTYTGTDVVGDWIFLVADVGNNYPPLDPTGKGHDRFSPKTTSAVGVPVGVPEPATLLLFGTGLIGLPFLRRKLGKK